MKPFERNPADKETDPIVWRSKQALVDVQVGLAALLEKVSPSFRETQRDKIAIVEGFVQRNADEVSACLRKRFVALVVAALNSATAFADFIPGAQRLTPEPKLEDVIASFADLPKQLKSAKELGLLAMLGPHACAIDGAMEEWRTCATHLASVAPLVLRSVAAGASFEVRNPLVVSVAAYFATWGTSTPPPYDSIKEMALFRDWLRTYLQTRIAEFVAPVAEALANFGHTFVDAAPKLSASEIVAKAFTHELVGDIVDRSSRGVLEAMHDDFSGFVGNQCKMMMAGKELEFDLLAVIECLVHVAQHYCFIKKEASGFEAFAKEKALKGPEVANLFGKVAAAAKVVKRSSEVCGKILAAEGREEHKTCVREMLRLSACFLEETGDKAMQTVVEKMETDFKSLKELRLGETITNFRQLARDGDFTQDRIARLTELASSEDGVAFYKAYKRIKKLRQLPEVAVEEQVKLREDMAVLEPQATTQGFDACAALKRDLSDCWQECANTMGELTTANTLWRSLQPGESREVLVNNLKKGLLNDGMEITPPLRLAIQSLTASE